MAKKDSYIKFLEKYLNSIDKTTFNNVITDPSFKEYQIKNIPISKMLLPNQKNLYIQKITEDAKRTQAFLNIICKYLNINTNQYTSSSLEDLVDDMTCDNYVETIAVILKEFAPQDIKGWIEDPSSLIHLDNVKEADLLSEDTEIKIEPIISSIEHKEETFVSSNEKQYLGYISVRDKYTNFCPRFTIEKMDIAPISDPRAEFPNNSNIEMYSSQDISLKNGKLCIISFDKEKLEENFSMLCSTELKSTQRKWKYDANKIDFNINENHRVYKIAKAQDFPVNLDGNQIDIVGDKYNSFAEEEQVLLECNERYYGPYTVKKRDNEKVPFSFYLDNTDGRLYTSRYYTFDNIMTYSLGSNSAYRIGKIVDFSKDHFDDRMTDEMLLKEHQANLDNSNRLSLLTNPKISLSIREKRQERLNKIAESIESLETLNESIKNIFIQTMNNLGEDEAIFEEWVDKYIFQSELKNKLQSFRMAKEAENTYKEFKKELEAVKAELEEAKNEHKQVQCDIESSKSVLAIQKDLGISIENETLTADIAELKREKERLEKEVDILDTTKNIGDLKKEENRLRGLYNTRMSDKIWIDNEIVNKENELTELEEKLKETNDKVRQKEEKEHKEAIEKAIEDSEKNIYGLCFDPLLANKLTEAAASWDNANQEEKYEKLVTYNNKLVLSENADEIKKYLCEFIRYYRPEYTDNDIINLYLCLTQGFLTVFSGAPGTGKTSICNIIANSLGIAPIPHLLENDNSSDGVTDCEDGLIPENYSRYISISVERGWTSKKDFLGYYNPLTKTFDKSNRHMYDAFKIMELEHKDSSNKILPYVVLLDEANLSPMEYYWGDFMKSSDNEDDNNMTVNLGEDYIFNVHSNLRFLATINNDHTTEILSPRLLDRAWVVQLPQQEKSFSFVKQNKNLPSGVESDKKIIAWNDLVDCFSVDDEGRYKDFESETTQTLKDLDNKFTSLGIQISHRVWRDIIGYIQVARHHLVLSDNQLSSEIVALDYAIAQRVLTKISCVVAGNGEIFKSLSDLCHNTNLKRSEDILTAIEIKSKQTNYYEFFC